MIQQEHAETKSDGALVEPDLTATDDGKLIVSVCDAMGTQVGQLVLDDLPPGTGLYVSIIHGGLRDDE